jgi:hypothetical protein
MTDNTEGRYTINGTYMDPTTSPSAARPGEVTTAVNTNIQASTPLDKTESSDNVVAPVSTTIDSSLPATTTTTASRTDPTRTATTTPTRTTQIVIPTRTTTAPVRTTTRSTTAPVRTTTRNTATPRPTPAGTGIRTQQARASRPAGRSSTTSNTGTTNQAVRTNPVGTRTGVAGRQQGRSASTTTRRQPAARPGTNVNTQQQPIFQMSPQFQSNLLAANQPQQDNSFIAQNLNTIIAVIGSITSCTLFMLCVVIILLLRKM